MASSGTTATAYTGVGQAAAKIWQEEGVRAFWKGNGVNIIRIFPYSAAQLMANDKYKRRLANAEGELTVPRRLAAGACAGMTATALTHPLDTLRLRLALPNSGYTGEGGEGGGGGGGGAALRGPSSVRSWARTHAGALNLPPRPPPLRPTPPRHTPQAWCTR